MRGDGAPMRRQARRHFQFYFLQGFAGGRGGEIVEHPFDAGEQLSACLQRQHDIVEAGRGGVAGDGRDLGGMFRQGAIIGGDKMLGADPVQRRSRERGGPVFEKGIGHGVTISNQWISQTTETSAVTLCSPGAIGGGGPAAKEAAIRYMGRGASLLPSLIDRIGPKATPAALA